MARRGEDAAEIEALLTARDENATRRRRQHHLPRQYYSLSDHAYSITLCARQQGEPFVIPELVAGVAAAIVSNRDRVSWLVFAYCLMPDHLHMVLGLPPLHPQDGRLPTCESPTNLLDLVSDFKRYTTTQVAWKHGVRGRLWQRDFYDHIPRNGVQVEKHCRYVLNNPVRKGLVEQWDDYPWSGVLDEW